MAQVRKEQSTGIDWDAAFDEIAAANRRAYDESDTPAARAERAKKRDEEHARGVRLGWWDEDGNPLAADEDDEDDDDEEAI
jgi:hypothetical protein